MTHLSISCGNLNDPDDAPVTAVTRSALQELLQHCRSARDAAVSYNIIILNKSEAAWAGPALSPEQSPSSV